MEGISEHGIAAEIIPFDLDAPFLLFPVRQASSSMQPDFPENSISFVTKIYPLPQRGDVVLLKKRISRG